VELEHGAIWYAQQGILTTYPEVLVGTTAPDLRGYDFI
jgi:hypothetical protein